MMTIDFGAWLGGAGGFIQTTIPLRAQIERARIEDNMTSVIFRRNGTDLLEQEVRIEYDNLVSEENYDRGMDMGFSRKGTLFGVRGHPTIDDLDVQVWDIFTMDDMEFTIIFVNKQTQGMVQATFEAVR